LKIWPIATAAVCAALLAAGVAGAAAAARTAGAGPPPVRMGVVLNALDNPFFVAMYEGATAGASELHVRATVRGVASNADLAGQAAQVRALVAARKDCYAVAPITATNLLPALRGVRRPIVIINSPIDPAAAKRAHVRSRAYVGTDDFAAGRLAGARMASLLPRGGEVALLGGWLHNVNSELRLGGFERGIRGTRVKVVAQVNADYDRTTAEIAAERLLRDHPRLSGFFAANDLMALGIADSVGAAGKAGTIRIIGLDGIPRRLTPSARDRSARPSPSTRTSWADGSRGVHGGGPRRDVAGESRCPDRAPDEKQRRARDRCVPKAVYTVLRPVQDSPAMIA